MEITPAIFLISILVTLWCLNRASFHLNFVNQCLSDEKGKPKEVNETLPEGYNLIEIGDKYMVKIKQGGFVCMNKDSHRVWTYSEYIARYCLTSDKHFAIKRAKETYAFYEAIK